MFLKKTMCSLCGHKSVLHFSNSSLARSNRILSEKLVHKVVWNKFKLQNQLVAFTEGSPHGSSFSTVLQFLLKIQLCSIFEPILTAICLMMEAQLALEQNIKVVDLWVSFPMRQASSHLDLYKLKKDQNTPN